MALIKDYPIGRFGFPGYCSGNADEARKFYTGLFGWDAKTMQMEGGEFNLFEKDGAVVAGMYQMPDDRKIAGVKAHWNSYLTVADIEKVVKDTVALGGKVLQGPFDADGDLMANLEDPTGARISVWQAVKGEDFTGKLHEVGALCWTELYTSDIKIAEEFYTKLFGWTTRQTDVGPKPYTIFGLADGNERDEAGMLQITDDMKGMKSQWIPYFLVRDVDATAQKALTLGGEAHGPWDIPTVGRICFMIDSEKAAFAVITPGD